MRTSCSDSSLRPVLRRSDDFGCEGRTEICEGPCAGEGPAAIWLVHQSVPLEPPWSTPLTIETELRLTHADSARLDAVQVASAVGRSTRAVSSHDDNGNGIRALSAGDSARLRGRMRNSGGGSVEKIASRVELLGDPEG